MHDEHGQPIEVSAESRAQGHEVGDINIPALAQWGVVLAILFLVASGITYGIYAYLITYRHEEKSLFTQQPGDPSEAQALRNAGVPLVQAQPVTEIKDFRTTEDARVEGTGMWKDGDGKTVNYIPINDAMKLIAQRGLPSMPAAGTMPMRTNTNATTPPPPPVGGGTPESVPPQGLNNGNPMYNPTPGAPMPDMPMPATGGGMPH